MDIDLAELASLVTLLKEADFSEFRYEKGDTRIVVQRGGAAGSPNEPWPNNATASGAATTSSAQQAAVAHQPATSGSQAAASPGVPATGQTPATPHASAAQYQTEVAPTTATDADVEVITAPMLGTFYSAPKPGEPAFVQVGGTVEPDSVVCIIEVMKLMNSVQANMHGTVVALHAQDGALVEYGQPLFSIKKT